MFLEDLNTEIEIILSNNLTKLRVSFVRVNSNLKRLCRIWLRQLNIKSASKLLDGKIEITLLDVLILYKESCWVRFLQIFPVINEIIARWSLILEYLWIVYLAVFILV